MDCFLVFSQTGIILYFYEIKTGNLSHSPNPTTKAFINNFIENTFQKQKLNKNHYKEKYNQLVYSLSNKHKLVFILTFSTKLIESNQNISEKLNNLKKLFLKKFSNQLSTENYLEEKENVFLEFDEDLSLYLKEMEQIEQNKDSNKYDYSTVNYKPKSKKSDKNVEKDFKPSTNSNSEENNSIISKLGNLIVSPFKLLNPLNLLNYSNNSTKLITETTEIEKKMISKNVNPEIAHSIASSIKTLLSEIPSNSLFNWGYRRQFNSKLSSSIRKIFENSLQKSEKIKSQLFSSKNSLNNNNKEKENNILKVALIGVNGVGKSTTLAKLCYLLSTKYNKKVSVAACDTFRAGAIEQLDLHSKRLSFKLYKDNYGSEPYKVAREGIRRAEERGDDIILIDTAGRLQNDKKLMKELCRLLAFNSIDIVLCVVDANCGNDSLDQIRKFSEIIEKEAKGDAKIKRHWKRERAVDGIILTKVDSVDDKIGSAVSMVYDTEIPVVFSGVGQTYEDLKVFDIDETVKKLIY